MDTTLLPANEEAYSRLILHVVHNIAKTAVVSACDTDVVVSLMHIQEVMQSTLDEGCDFIEIQVHS